MSNFKQISAATINYTQINHGCLPKVFSNAIAQTIGLDDKTGEATLKAYYYGGDQVGQVDYFMLNSFTAKTSPPPKADGELGKYTIDFKKSGKIWKCPTTRRDMKRNKTGRLGIVYAPHPSPKWNLFNYVDGQKKKSEPEEKAKDVKYANYRFTVSYDQIPMFAELCEKNRSGEGNNVKPPHNGNYEVAFLDGHIESCVGQKGYLHWCVGCEEFGDVKYTETPDRGVKQ